MKRKKRTVMKITRQRQKNQVREYLLDYRNDSVFGATLALTGPEHGSSACT